uniref:Integrin alpha-X-like n=1 Tax=Phallusia mammillata TaxID=59560 RepID=A0A6F9DFE4_9ASCI|nr:integrin alpha-X-like [Phallusia mammillata]
MVEVERKYSNSCYSIMKAFTDKTPVVEVKEVTSCSPKHQCLTVKTVADAQVKMNGDSFEATVTYGACIPSIACPVTSCSDLMTSLRGIDLPFTMNFTTCEVECCDEDLCNDDQPPPTTATPTTLPTTTALPLTTDEYGCWNQRRDVMFLLDGSGSFTALEFMEILKFVNQLVEGFDLELTRVGVMQFSHWYRHRPMTTRAQTLLKTHIYLGQYSDADQLQAAISGINHHGYTTYIAHAIEKAISIDFPRAGRFSDSCTSKIIVVVSDGKATDANYLPTTTGLGRALGFNFFAVGIGDREMRELQIIANGKVGSDERLFVVPWADQLTTVARQLSAEILM